MLLTKMNHGIVSASHALTVINHWLGNVSRVAMKNRTVRTVSVNYSQNDVLHVQSQLQVSNFKYSIQISIARLKIKLMSAKLMYTLTNTHF